MKTKLLALLLLCLNISASAENDITGNMNYDFKYSKKKTIDANFTVNELYTLDFEGRYSDITISTTNSNMLSFHIEITGMADKEEYVDKLLQNIDFEFNDNKSNNTIYVNSVFCLKNIARKIGYEISISITMPETIKLNIDNMYGDINIDKLKNELNVNLRYADLTIDSLFAKNNIDIMYGDIMTKYVNNINANIKYGNINIVKGNNINVDIMYGDAEFGYVNKINGSLRYSEIYCKAADSTIIDIMYSDVHFTNANYISIKDGYSDVYINNLKDEIKYRANYGDLEISSVDKAFKSIDIDANYSDLEINLTEDHNFNYDIELLYGGFVSPKKILEGHATKIIERDSKYQIIGNYNDPEYKHKLLVNGCYTDLSLDD